MASQRKLSNETASEIFVYIMHTDVLLSKLYLPNKIHTALTNRSVKAILLPLLCPYSLSVCLWVVKPPNRNMWSEDTGVKECQERPTGPFWGTDLWANRNRIAILAECTVRTHVGGDGTNQQNGI